jgi:hypothetical protein
MDLGGSVDSARNDTRLKGEVCQTRPSYDAFSTAADVRKERADAVNDSHEVHVEHPSALCSSASALARVERRDLGVAFKRSSIIWWDGGAICSTWYSVSALTAVTPCGRSTPGTSAKFQREP